MGAVGEFSALPGHGDLAGAVGQFGQPERAEGGGAPDARSGLASESGSSEPDLDEPTEIRRSGLGRIVNIRYYPDVDRIVRRGQEPLRGERRLIRRDAERP